MRFQYSLTEYVALLALLAGLGTFAASLFLPASSDGMIGLAMLMLGVLGVFGAAPSAELWAYSFLGTLLNLALPAAASWSARHRNVRRPVRVSCGAFLLAGFLVLTLFPARNSDGAIGYRTWVNSFLFAGVSLLLPVSRRVSG